MLFRKFITFPLRVIVMPAALCLLLLNVVFRIITGLSSLVTNIVAGLFLFGSVAGWMAGANAVQIWHCIGIGLFFLITPQIANWIVDKVTTVLYKTINLFKG